jgi:hypothetical protein
VRFRLWQGQCHAGLGRQHRVAGGEDQAQQVVADFIGARRIQPIDKIGHDQGLLRFEFMADLLVFDQQHLGAAQVVQSAVLAGGHEPGARVGGHAVARPMLQRRHQGVLRQLLGQADVAHQPRHASDDLGAFTAPNFFNGTVTGLQ